MFRSAAFIRHFKCQRMTTNALEKGHTMKKIFALACATSALAIVSAANAARAPWHTALATSSQSRSKERSLAIALSPVPEHLMSRMVPSLRVETKTALLRSQTSVTRAALSRNGLQLAASRSPPMSSCNLSLISANGGLENQSNSSANKISYSAVVYDSQSSPTLVPVPTAASATFSAFNSKFDATYFGERDD